MDSSQNTERAGSAAANPVNQWERTAELRERVVGEAVQGRITAGCQSVHSSVPSTVRTDSGSVWIVFAESVRPV